MLLFDLQYGDHQGWIATTGSVPELTIDPVTGQEDRSERRAISAYLESWRPGQLWNPQPICLHFSARGKKCVYADRIYHNHIGPFLSKDAVERLRPFLEKEGHVLPLDVINSDERFFLWWVPVIENSVDYDHSEKFPNGKSIKKYAFNEKVLEGVTAFRPHFPSMYNPYGQGLVLVNEEFRDAWLDAGLTGIKFKPV